MHHSVQPQPFTAVLQLSERLLWLLSPQQAVRAPPTFTPFLIWRSLGETVSFSVCFTDMSELFRGHAPGPSQHVTKLWGWQPWGPVWGGVPVMSCACAGHQLQGCPVAWQFQEVGRKEGMVTWVGSRLGPPWALWTLAAGHPLCGHCRGEAVSLALIARCTVSGDHRCPKHGPVCCMFPPHSCPTEDLLWGSREGGEVLGLAVALSLLHDQVFPHPCPQGLQWAQTSQSSLPTVPLKLLPWATVRP